MENNFNTSNDIFGFGFDDQARDILVGIARWTKIIAISAFASYGISLIAQLVAKDITVTSDVLGGASKIGKFIITAIAAAVGVLYNVYLFKFSNEIVEGVNSKNQISVDKAFGSLKVYFQILGIILIIALVLFVFFFLLAVIGAVADR